jgi:hypothetical protein
MHLKKNFMLKNHIKKRRKEKDFQSNNRINWKPEEEIPTKENQFYWKANQETKTPITQHQYIWINPEIVEKSDLKTKWL